MGRACIALAVLAASFLLFLSGTAHAEYPPPGSTLTVGAGSLGAISAAIAPGSSIDILCQVRDPSGNPVSGVPCVFTIISEPGTDASIGSKSATKTTGPDGIARATLFAGSTPGTIQVMIEAAGGRSLVTVQVGAPTRLPPTGGTPPGSSLPIPVLVAAATGAALCLGAISIMALKRASGR